MDRTLSRRLLAEVLGSAFLAAIASATATKVAAGTAKVAHGGAMTIKVKLTTHGRTVVKKVKARQRLKLTAETSFTPKGGTKVTTKKAFSLKR